MSRHLKSLMAEHLEEARRKINDARNCYTQMLAEGEKDPMLEIQLILAFEYTSDVLEVVQREDETVSKLL